MDLATLQTRQNKLRLDANAIIDAADKDGRALTDTETKSYDALITEMESVGKSLIRRKGDESMMAEIERIAEGASYQPETGRPWTKGKSFGQQVVESKGFKDMIELAKRSRRFESDLIEIKAAPVLVDGLVPADSTGQIVGPTREPTVAALFAQGRTNGNSVTYNRETSFTNAAAAVAEGTAKPESEIVLAPIVEPVRKYAHFITLSKEALEDIPGIGSRIDNRLRSGLALEIDRALLNGSTTPPSLVGILNRVGLSPAVVQGATESVADAILRQAAATQTASGLPADGMVIHPDDWLIVRTAKDTQGQYYGNGPFASPSPAGPTLWGQLRVAVSPSIAPKTVLVGSFLQGAQLLWRESMTVTVSNSHANYFTLNLLAVLIEARLSEIVTMPESFGIVTLLPTVP